MTVVKAAAVQMSPVLYSRPGLLSLLIDHSAIQNVHEHVQA